MLAAPDTTSLLILSIHARDQMCEEVAYLAWVVGRLVLATNSPSNLLLWVIDCLDRLQITKFSFSRWCIYDGAATRIPGLRPN